MRQRIGVKQRDRRAQTLGNMERLGDDQSVKKVRDDAFNEVRWVARSIVRGTRSR